MEPHIKITIPQKGEAEIEAIGYVGQGCKDLTKPFEDIYTNEVSSVDKPELHIGAQTSIQSAVGG